MSAEQEHDNDNDNDNNNAPGPASLADELRQESERLRGLAQQFQAREQALAEMEANYPFFKEAVYAWLRAKALAEVPPLGDKDLETLVKEEGGQRLVDFIDEL